ncbi:MAG: box helicase protein [Gemmatimonadetes bacterium]|nr:box helicase protein [Gemmatimonadota bacterium]
MVFVFTQERFHLLQSEAPAEFTPDIVVVDEAQKVGDGARGVLLQDVLDAVIRRSPRVRVIFASPMTSNAELLLEDAPVGTTTQTIASEQIAVNQNLLWVSQTGYDTRDWTLSQCIGESTIELGQLTLPSRPTTVGKRLPMLAHNLTDADGGGSLVYVEGAAAAEKAAQLLWDMQGRPNGEVDPEVQALIDLTKNVIHGKYALAETLTRRVAFHYGNMPLIIRAEVERLFKSGKIRFLVCTSTLVEGVNLPAKSIFVRGPTKGRNTPMGEMDFWNLAGRAGRLGKEFQGNVVCVDPEDEHVWKSRPPRIRQRYPITRTVDTVVSQRGDELLKYIEDDTPRSAYDPAPLEHAFVYFYGEHLRHGSLDASPKAARYSAAFINRLTGLCARVFARSELPADIVFRNPGVSPIAQQRLLEYFREKGSEVEELIPAFPEDPAAAQRYVRVVGRISTYLSGDHQRLNWPHAILVVNWMRGHPLARIISEAADYWVPRGKTLAAVIRDTMRDVEEYARFRFAKYSSCYVDVLRYHLRELGEANRAAEIPRLSMWLEFGASQGTQIALMGLGLSRTTAIRLSEIIAADDLDMDAASNWISAAKLDTLDLSPVMLAEIQRARVVAA